MKFCSHCGQSISLLVPDGDDRQRHVCTGCDVIHYQNPRIITGCIPVLDNKVLLCKRAIEPRRGWWTLPAGYLENGETLEEGALRESREEANLTLQLKTLYSVVDIPHIHQVYMIYLADILTDDFGPGSESLETRLFDQGSIPWSELAFPVITWTLKRFFEDLPCGVFPLKTGAISRDQALKKADPDNT